MLVQLAIHFPFQFRCALIAGNNVTMNFKCHLITFVFFTYISEMVSEIVTLFFCPKIQLKSIKYTIEIHLYNFFAPQLVLRKIGENKEQNCY